MTKPEDEKWNQSQTGEMSKAARDRNQMGTSRASETDEARRERERSSTPYTAETDEARRERERSGGLQTDQRGEPIVQLLQPVILEGTLALYLTKVHPEAADAALEAGAAVIAARPSQNLPPANVDVQASEEERAEVRGERAGEANQKTGEVRTQNQRDPKDPELRTHGDPARDKDAETRARSERDALGKDAERAKGT